jgi:hypothetical protein
VALEPGGEPAAAVDDAWLPEDLRDLAGSTAHPEPPTDPVVEPGAAILSDLEAISETASPRVPDSPPPVELGSDAFSADPSATAPHERAAPGADPAPGRAAAGADPDAARQPDPADRSEASSAAAAAVPRGKRTHLYRRMPLDGPSDDAVLRATRWAAYFTDVDAAAASAE